MLGAAALLMALAALDVALLNDGTLETLSLAGAGSIESRRYFHGQRAQGNPLDSGHPPGTRNSEQSSQGLPCFVGMYLNTDADANTNAKGIAASLEDACRVGMVQRKPFRSDNCP